MRTTALRLLILALAISPMVATAQSNIKSAFDAIIHCQNAEIKETHSFEKDPDTGIKKGQRDVYYFTLPANKFYLIKNVIAAFDLDKESSFSVECGKALYAKPRISVAVGDGSGKGETIDEPGSEYIYALFLPSKDEDKEGIYRYAYGFCYTEIAKEIKGKLVITYATTLKYRQQVEKKNQLESFRGFSSNPLTRQNVTNTNDSWFEKLMSYLQSMTMSVPPTRIALATKAYQLIGNMDKYPDVTERDKETAREILQGMISDDLYSETILNKLLQQCLAEIK